MPRGMVEFPAGSGVFVSPFSPEYRAAHPFDRKQKPGPKPKARTVIDEFDATFEPPPELSGDPKEVKAERLPPPPKTKATPKDKAQEKAEDIQDLCDIIATLFSAVALATQFAGWQVSREEAESIARPLQRILIRHKHLDRAVRQFTDPAALLGAVLVVGGSHAGAYAAHLRATKAKNVTPTIGGVKAEAAPNATPNTPEPPPTGTNGRMSYRPDYESVIKNIAQTP